MDPYASSVFASSYAAVEQFNAQRYYAETGVPSSALPTGTTGPSGSTRPASLSTYLPFVAMLIIIWAVERGKLGFLRVKKK